MSAIKTRTVTRWPSEKMTAAGCDYYLGSIPTGPPVSYKETYIVIDKMSSHRRLQLKEESYQLRLQGAPQRDIDAIDRMIQEGLGEVEKVLSCERVDNPEPIKKQWQEYRERSDF